MIRDQDRMLLELEQRLARIGRRISIAEASDLIADDFVEIGVSGTVWTKSKIVPLIADCPLTEGEIEDFSVRELSPSICHAIYRLGSSLRSSIWRKSGGRWQIIFHQGTAAPAVR
jgi:glyoxylase I family protein